MYSCYLRAQVERINVEKWCEGCRIQRDPGPEFVIHWINQNAARFREEWEQSRCKECHNCFQCGYKATRDCCEFAPHFE